MKTALKAAIGVTGVVAVVGGIVIGSVAITRAAERDRVTTAWARFARCTVGDEPLRSEAPSTRVKRIALGARAAAYTDPAAATWPKRCADPAKELSAAWKAMAAHETKYGDPTYDIDSVAAELARGATPTNPVDDVQLDNVWIYGAPFAARHGDARDVPLPPQAPPSCQPRDFAPLYPTSAIVMDGDLLVDRSIHLQFYQHDDVWTFSGAPLRAMRDPISPDVPDAPLRHLVALADGAAPALSVEGTSITPGVYAVSSGKLLLPEAAPRLNGAYAGEGGTVVSVEQDVAPHAYLPTFTLLRRREDGTVTKTRLDRPRAPGGDWLETHVVGDALVWLEGSASAAREIFARSLDADDVGPVVDLGRAPQGFEERSATAYTMCRTDEGEFIDVEGRDRHLLLSRVHGAWRPAVDAGSGGAFACHRDVATYSALRPDSARKLWTELAYTVCSQDGCTTTKTSLLFGGVMPALPADTHVDVRDVGGTLVLAWLVDGDGVYLRTAAPEDLDRAPVRAVLDAAYERNGNVTVNSVALRGRRDAALLLVDTSAGPFAFSVDRTGAVTPVAVTR